MLPQLCCSSAEDGAAGGGWDPLLTSATTARDLQGVLIPVKNHGTGTVTVTERRAGASSEHLAQISFHPVLWLCH